MLVEQYIQSVAQLPAPAFFQGKDSYPIHDQRYEWQEIAGRKELTCPKIALLINTSIKKTVKL